MTYNPDVIRQQNADREAAALGGLFAQPLPSHTSDPWTSKEAAYIAAETAYARRHMVLSALEQLGEQGATADEIDTRYHWTHLTAARRLTELEKAGLVVCRGDTRPSNTGSQARVYRRSHVS